jgi:hypothetical protein
MRVGIRFFGALLEWPLPGSSQPCANRPEEPREVQENRSGAKNNDRATGSKILYRTLSQYAVKRDQTVQSEPNDGLSVQQLTSEPERNHPFAKPFRGS